MTNTFKNEPIYSQDITQAMRDINALEAAIPMAFLLKWGSHGTGDGEFNSPWSIAIDALDFIYVSEYTNNRIQKFDSSGGFILKWGSGGTGDGEFSTPYGIAFDSSANVYVADTGNHRIQKFDSSGNFLLKWGSNGTGDGEFSFPWGIAFDSSANVYVADTGNHRIQKFDSSGNFLLKWGSYGTGDGEFSQPHDVAVDSSAKVYVADTENFRIQKVQPFSEAPFYAYTTTTKTSLGTPDGGVSVPALQALCQSDKAADICPDHIEDMRDAIETLAPYYINAATGNPFNWTASSADNLYYVAMGDRTEYGATGGAAYDWTRTKAAMIGSPPYDIDIGEVRECIDVLQASALA